MTNNACPPDIRMFFVAILLGIAASACAPISKPLRTSQPVKPNGITLYIGAKTEVRNSSECPVLGDWALPLRHAVVNALRQQGFEVVASPRDRAITSLLSAAVTWCGNPGSRGWLKLTLQAYTQLQISVPFTVWRVLKNRLNMPAHVVDRYSAGVGRELVAELMGHFARMNELTSELVRGPRWAVEVLAFEH